MDLPLGDTMIRNRKSLLLASTSVILLMLAANNRAMAQQPSGGQVVSGAASISQNVNTTTVNQSTNRAIINWQGFSVGAGNTAQFNLPSSGSAVLNRVTGSSPSQLLGNIRSNGQVYLINPHGVVVGNGARIETNRFVASTLDVSNSDFMAGGAMRFQGSSENAVVNQGEIVSGVGGVALIARKIENSGQIRAEGGTASLAAGSEILLQANNSVVAIASPALTEMAQAGIDNAGLIEAARVELRAVQGNAYGLAVNNSGTVRASGVETHNGRVFLTGGSVSNNGTVAAQRGARGGDVVITGETVALGNAAQVSASGRQGGGTVNIGGGWQGNDAEIANSRRTSVATGARIDANAIEQGDGGTVVVWSDGRTSFDGMISARAGADGGNGGNAEVSGKQVLAYNGLADLRAPKGTAGSLLLDPHNIIISNGTNDANCSPGSCTPSGDDSILNVATLVAQLNMSNVNVQTSGAGTQVGNITVSNDVSWSSSNRLTLTADANIAINANITNNSGDLRLVAGPGSSPSSPYLITSAAGTTIYVNQLELRTNQFTNVNLAGVIETNVLYLDYFGGGSITATNAANYINHVQLPGSARTMTGNINVYSAVDELGILGNSGAVLGSITFKNAGDIRLHSSAVLNTTSGGIVSLAAVGGNIINTAGTGVIGPDTVAYKLYSKDAAGNDLDGLTPTTVNGVAFPDNPNSGNVLYIDDGSAVLPPAVRQAQEDPPVYFEGVIEEVPVTVISLNPPNSLEDFKAAAMKDAWLMLSFLAQNWEENSNVPYDFDAFMQFALAMCVQGGGDCTKDALKAVTDAMAFLSQDSKNYAVVAAYPVIAKSAGWGQNSFLNIGRNSAVNGVSNEIWKNMTSFSNLTATATLLDTMLKQIKPGEPGYGLSLTDALKGIGNESSPVSAGVQSVLLQMKADEIIAKTRQGLPLTQAEQTFANGLVQQLVRQGEQTLAKIEKDFTDLQEKNQPPGRSLEMLQYMGTAPTEEMKNELITMTPQQNYGSQQFQQAATTAARLMEGIGQNVDASGIAGEAAMGTAAIAAMTSVVGATVTVAGIKGGTVGAASILGLSASVAAKGAASAGAIAAAAAGPVMIGVAAVAMIAAAAVKVAEIAEFRNAIDGFGAILQITKMGNTSLATVSMYNFGSAANMQTALLNMLTGGGSRSGAGI
jgi:filamentous hemagglutinin family protein